MQNESTPYKFTKFKYLIYGIISISLSIHCLKIQYSPLDTSQPGIAGIIALIVPGLLEMESNSNNGLPGVQITEAGGSTTATEGGAGDSYTVVLTSQPTADVTIAVSADAQVRVNGVASVNLLFTSANWDTTQTVTVTAVDDGVTEGSHNGTITHSSSSVDTGYNGIAVASVTVSITDNDFLLSTNPVANATNVPPCTGNPCRASIILRFDQSMNTAITPTLVTELANSNTNYVVTPNTNSEFAWTATSFANDTLTINISWYWFPETSRIRYTLSNLENLAGISIASFQRIFTTTGSGQVFPVKDTGQTLCYTTSSTATTPCPSATFPGQDGDFTNIPTARSFTGPTPHGTFGTNFTTLDNVTSLRFASCSVGQSGAGCTGLATAMIFEAGVNACSDLNIQNSGNGYWGLTNWRLPTQNELATLPNYGVTGPAIDTVSFPSTVSNAYWASGAYQNFLRGYGVNFIGGTINDGAWDVKSNTNYVRCVSAPTTVTTASYTDNNDGTISDNNTGLRWQKCSNAQTNDASCSGTALTTTWQNQLLYCDSLNLGVHVNASNWRLPSAMELTSILDVSSAINSTYFPNAAGGTYVSSTSHSFNTGRHNVFHRNNVSMPLNFKTDPNYAARCVSTGP